MIQIATVADFFQAFDDYEGLILADPDFADDDIANLNIDIEGRIQLALDDAHTIILSYYVRCIPIGKASIQSAWRRNQLVIARYLLDTVKARQPVKEAYLETLKRLEQATELEDNGSMTESELEELGIISPSSRKISYSSGQRSFTDESLANYRKGSLFWR